jgi:hypothetical protein
MVNPRSGCEPARRLTHTRGLQGIGSACTHERGCNPLFFIIPTCFSVLTLFKVRIYPYFIFFKKFFAKIVFNYSLFIFCVIKHYARRQGLSMVAVLQISAFYRHFKLFFNFHISEKNQHLQSL